MEIQALRSRVTAIGTTCKIFLWRTMCMAGFPLCIQSRLILHCYGVMAQDLVWYRMNSLLRSRCGYNNEITS